MCPIPPQQSALNGALTQAGFIQGEKKSSDHQKQSQLHVYTQNPSSKGVLISAINSYGLYKTTAKYYVDLPETTVKRTWSK